MKILINTPYLGILGGVCNHYNGLKSYWSSNIKYNTVGHRYGFSGALLLPFDIIKFILRIIFFNPDLILLNPSLLKKSLQRDSVFLIISNFFNIRTVIFIHGWDINIQEEIDRGIFKFKEKYKKADSFIVLSKAFKKKLSQWGVKKKIYLATTKVDDSLLANYNINRKSTNKSILFLSRVEKYKGIYIALDTHKILKQKHHELSLTIAGDGDELINAKKYVKQNKIKDVIFSGRLSGKKLTDTFFENSVYLFPTFHGEGMPTSVLEAMAFGLTVITRPVGGINDFFNDKKMGRITDSLDSKFYADLIDDYFSDLNQLKNICKYNHKYALDNFMASVVSRKMEDIFKNEINEK